MNGESLGLIVNLVAVGVMGLLLWIFRKMQGSLVSGETCGKLQAQCQKQFMVKIMEDFVKKKELEGDMEEKKKDLKDRFSCIEQKIQQLRDEQQNTKEAVMNQISSLKDSMGALRLELKQDMISVLKKRFSIPAPRSKRKG